MHLYNSLMKRIHEEVADLCTVKKTIIFLT